MGYNKMSEPDPFLSHQVISLLLSQVLWKDDIWQMVIYSETKQVELLSQSATQVQIFFCNAIKCVDVSSLHTLLLFVVSVTHCQTLCEVVSGTFQKCTYLSQCLYSEQCDDILCSPVLPNLKHESTFFLTTHPGLSHDAKSSTSVHTVSLLYMPCTHQSFLSCLRYQADSRVITYLNTCVLTQ